jgi:hypothetical protein
MKGSMRPVVISIALAGSILLAVSAVPAGAEAPQSVVLGQGNVPPTSGLLGQGLFDPSRLDLRHSLSYSMVSGGGASASGGLWVTSLGYRANDQLRLGADVGVFLDSSGNGPVLERNSVFLRGLDMSYRAGDNFLLHVSYVRTPGAASAVFGPRSLYGTMPGASPWSTPSGLER